MSEENAPLEEIRINLIFLYFFSYRRLKHKAALSLHKPLDISSKKYTFKAPGYVFTTCECYESIQ